MTLNEIELYPELLRNNILMGTGGLIILLMTVASFLLYFKYRNHLRAWLYSRGLTCLKRGERSDAGKLFDAFFSFADHDFELVFKHFLPELEEKHPFYQLFIPQRDCEAGTFEINKLMERVMKSKRTIILLTNHYLKDKFCMEILRMAFAISLEEKLHRIILVNFGTLPPPKEMDQSLKVIMETSRCLKFRAKLFWDMLRYEMPEKRLPKTDEDHELFGDKFAEDVPLLPEF